MKNIKNFLILICFITTLSACTQKNFIEKGTPLSNEKVSKIVEGSSTESQILSIFGEPTNKTVINSNETQWTYQYTKKSSTSHMLIGETQYNIFEGKLDIIISKGVVTWFNYDENQKQKKW
ncbi:MULTISPECIES: outer membrane protein assembly factor BamE domain-containing protein [unclassified Gilliamella]|uniref:outer membrane protein assembly factor BamE domain-containing protein n=1 Tax=unclassified Gilliamella TaxID=2685620 RepID=UPI001326AD8F|nr:MULTISPECIES: outer membrane protein assembly factor BamE [unclassified Gilliamella]MWN31595.1 outer membrane protein assembly factor BamE [Gilliamella sp. Pra-s60]MWP28702.1 outer membrane protein assembly factor BamE [Gilliamella sp. Pra-s54]